MCGILLATHRNIHFYVPCTFNNMHVQLTLSHLRSKEILLSMYIAQLTMVTLAECIRNDKLSTYIGIWHCGTSEC